MSLKELRIVILSFSLVFAFGHFFIKRKKIVFHSIWLIFSFFILGVGPFVQNTEYYCLEKFIELENANKLDEARIKYHDDYVQTYLNQFETADEFKNYIKDHDNFLSVCFFIIFGWFFVFLWDILKVLMTYLRSLKRKSTS
ncbi:MAG: hypothetical protein NEHIOOID_00346 [Holosporales bacterium]